MTKLKNVRFYSPLSLLAIAACSKSSDVAQQFDLNGHMVSGPLKGATAFIDLNGNNKLDAGEVSVATLADGSYTLSSSTATARVVGITDADTIDTSTGALAGSMTLSAPAGASMVTPLTTLIDQSSDLTVEELKTALGIDVDPLTFNPFGAGVDPASAVAAEKAAKQIASVLTTVSQVTGGNTASFTQAVKSLASALDGETAVDFSSAVVIGAVLDDALTKSNTTMSSANKELLQASIVNVNKILDDTLVEGVNLNSSATKNALATVSQFAETVAELGDLTVDVAAASFGGFDDFEAVKTAALNAAPSDISLDGNIIKAGVAAVATASAVDPDGNPVVFSISEVDDYKYFSIDADTGVLTVDSSVDGYDDKTSFNVVVKATDYTEKGVNSVFDSGVDTKGKSYSESFTLVKQDPDAFLIGKSLTLNDFDAANGEAVVEDNTVLTGSVAGGTFNVASDSVKLNLKNLQAVANGEGGSAPSISLTFEDVPTTTEVKTASLNVTLTDGVDATADTGERVISLDFNLSYSSDGTNVTLEVPAQDVTGFYTTSDGTKVDITIANSAEDVLVLSGGVLGAPTSLDVKVASIVSIAKDYGSVDLLSEGEYNLNIAIKDGISLQASDGSGAVSSVNMGLSIVDEGEIFQLSSNILSVSSEPGEAASQNSMSALGGVLSLDNPIEIEESDVTGMASGKGFPDLSLSLGKVANSDGTAKLKLSLVDGLDASVSAGERGISFDVELMWDSSEGEFKLADGDISGSVTDSAGNLTAVTISNGEADFLSVTSGSNELSGSSLNLKMAPLIKASSDFASIDLLEKGNYTLQVETVSGIKLYDATGEKVSKINAVVAVVDDAPLDVSLSASSIAENSVADAVVADLTSAYDGTNQTTTTIFSLVDGDSDSSNNPFKVVDGKLKVDNAGLLDYETSPSFDVSIKGVDSETGRSVTELFSINLSDGNDLPVLPTGAQAFSIGEGAAAGASTAYTGVEATDADKADTLTYSLVSQKDEDDADVTLFSVEPSTGAIKVGSTALATGSDNGVYTVIIGVTDGNSAVQEVTVTATVTANVAPEVTSSAAGTSVSEKATAGAVVYTITGDDSDGDNSALEFGISETANFEVDKSTGVVTVKEGHSLDFETVPTETFSVTVTDEKGASSAGKTVSVSISDANDVPTFTASTATATAVNETALIGSTVFTAVADDKDASDAIVYSLSGTDSSSFAINSETGAVTLKSALDYETKSTFEFVVAATDNDGEKVSQTVTGDVNDRVENPFTVKASAITEDMSDDGIYGDVGDILITVETSFDSFDTKFSDYDASEKIEFEFATDDFTLEEKLVTQTDSTSGTAKYDSGLKGVQSASPSAPYDIGITKVAMVSGTSNKELVFFVVDSSEVSGSFDLTVSGTYDVIDFGVDGLNATSDDVTTAQLLDPFTFTVDIA